MRSLAEEKEKASSQVEVCMSAQVRIFPLQAVCMCVCVCVCVCVRVWYTCVLTV